MKLLFLISLHFLLMIVYMMLVELKKSRLSYGHLLFAFFFPFVGEVCLVAADFGKSPADQKLVKPFKEFSVAKSEMILKSSECIDGQTITREQLLQVIKLQPDNFIKVLKSSMKSEDIEVIHIAASTIMKMQRTYENKIKEASDQYSEMPDNMARLKNYILAIQDYYIQGILNGEAASSLLEQQAELLNKYLTVLPEDKEMGILMVKNLVLQKKYIEAENAAEFIRYSYMIDIDLWELSVDVYTTTGNKKKLQEMTEEAEKFFGVWSQADKLRWIEIQKGMII